MSFFFQSQSRSSNRKRTILEVERLERREVMTSASSLWSIGNGVYDLSQTLALHSNPTATRVIYLDFDGNTTGDVYGTSWDNLTSPAWDPSGNGAAFSDSEKQIIQRVWARVAEDYAPFNVDVTTQDPGLEGLRKTSASDVNYGVRVVITPNDQPAPGSGGVAYIGSFNFNTDTPAYVFNSGEKNIAEAVSHEVGHTLGLNHDGTATLGYYSGQGSGATSWGPIMGASYSPNVTQFSKGEYSGANNQEDDLAIITTQNGFGYRTDDVGNTFQTATSLLPQGTTQVGAVYGVIEQNTDADVFSFWSGAGTIALNVDPATLGPNLAVKADLYNAAGTLLASFNPPSALNAVVSFLVPTAGQYFLKVSGTGKGDPLTNGFSNYGSLGNYRITGTVPAYGGSTPTNSPPVAVNDTATAVVGTPVTINVLANDSDPNNDALTLVSISNVVGGTATISGNSVVFTATSAGTGSFTYVISDGKGGTATATATVTATAPPTTPQTRTFTNDTDVAISPNSYSVVTSSINVSGLTGTLQDVDVKLNVYHTWDSDLVITLIAPDGTRIVLFNRQGGSGDNILGTTFDDSAARSISTAAAPFTGTFRPWQLLSALNGKNPNGTWRLEIRDNYPLDGGRLDNWSLVLKTGSTTAPTVAAGAAIAADPFARQTGETLADYVARIFANEYAGPARTPLFANPAALRAFTRSLSDSQLRSLFEGWFGAAPEADLPRAR